MRELDPELEHDGQDLDAGMDPEGARELAAVVALLRSLPEPEPRTDLTARVMKEVHQIERRPRVLRAWSGSRVELNAALAAGIACIAVGIGLGVIQVPVPGIEGRRLAVVDDAPALPNVQQVRPTRRAALVVHPMGVGAGLPGPSVAFFGARAPEAALPVLATQDPNQLDRHLDSELNALQLDPEAYFRRLERVQQRELFVRRLAERAARRGDATQVALSVRSVPHEYTGLMVDQLLHASLVQAVSER